MLIFVATLWLGSRHDYIAYEWHWRDVLLGLSPWVSVSGTPTTNTYGPVHLLFAPLWSIYSLLPKVFFVYFWIQLGFFFLKTFQTKDLSKVFYFFWFGSPLFLTEFISWGHQESVVAFLIVGFVYFLEQKKVFLSALMMGLAVAYKFYPLFLVPYAFVRLTKKDRFLFSIGLFLLLITAFGFSWLLWGSDVLVPLTYNNLREPKFFSIFRFLKSELNPYSVVFTPELCAMLSKSLMIAFSCLQWVQFLRKKVTVIRAVLAELLIVFIFYQVGHIQFHHTVLFLIPLMVKYEFGSSIRSFLENKLGRSFVVYVLFLNGVQCFNVIYGQYSAEVESLSNWISVPYFILISKLLWELNRPKANYLHFDSASSL